MSEARDIIRKLLPHLRTLSLDADIDTLHDVKALIREAEEFLAKPENEPVGVVDGNGVEWILPQAKELEDGQPLYAEPPARKSLSDDELDELHLNNADDPMAFARAIEAAHGIKE
jgi:hypothetical protein